MSLSLVIRPMTPADIDEVSALAHRIWRAHYPGVISDAQIEYLLGQQYTPESLAQQIADGHSFLLACIEKEVVGFISVIDEQNENYFIRKFYVDQSKARRGIGKALLAAVEQNRPHWKKLSLMVNRRNWKAINFYFRQGFTIAGVEEIDCGGGFFMNDFVMVKQLGR